MLVPRLTSRVTLTVRADAKDIVSIYLSICNTAHTTLSAILTGSTFSRITNSNSTCTWHV